MSLQIHLRWLYHQTTPCKDQSCKLIVFIFLRHQNCYNVVKRATRFFHQLQAPSMSRIHYYCLLIRGWVWNDSFTLRITPFKFFFLKLKKVEKYYLSTILSNLASIISCSFFVSNAINMGMFGFIKLDKIGTFRKFRKAIQ